MDNKVISKIDELANLVVIVLGARNSGKSYTWNVMFDRKVRMGTRLRPLNISGKRVDIFLVNGSPEERRKYIGDIVVYVFLVSGSSEERRLYVDKIIKVRKPRIVLCSVQDTPEAEQTFKYFADRGYFMLIHWLNPGYSQERKKGKIVYQLLNNVPPHTFIFYEMDGNDNAKNRVQEMKDFIYSWAKRKDLFKRI